ncbi:phage tail tape measure protein [Sphingopyxis indica]|uniref:phage tail tape measure protein n=1 Tax=Sphingopyxis indica TaxID=436663 RepID=UPI00293932AC|nr:phage tail tape measure protein [Sphingopyxis indica]WOF43767.1 phage tail tape measure protein [Sphingopyxis indica]
MLGALIGALRVSLSADSAEFEKGMKRSKKEMSGFGKAAGALKGALAGLIGVAAINEFRQMGRAALDAVGGLGEAAAAVGVTTGALQEYRYMATQVGLSTEEMDNTVAQLTRRLGDAAVGVKEPADALKKLGISLTDANGRIRNTEDVLPEVAEGMKRLKDPTMQASIAADLFGRSGQKLLPLLIEGKDKMREWADEARRMGVVISDETIANADKIADQLAAQDAVLEARMNALLSSRAESIGKIETTWQDIKLGALDAGVAVIDFFDAFGDGAKSAWADFSDFNEQQHRWGDNIKSTLRAAWDELRAFNDRLVDWQEGIKSAFAEAATSAVSSVAKLVAGVRDYLGAKLNAIFDDLRAKIKAAGDWFHELWDRVVGHSYIPDMVDAIGAHMARLDAEMLKPIQQATSKAAEEFRSLQQDVSAILDRLFPERAERNQFDRDTKSLNDYYDALIARGGDALALEKQRAAAVEALQRAYLGLSRDYRGVAAGEDPRVGITVVDGQKTLEETTAGMLNDLPERVEKAFGALRKNAEATKVQVVESFAQMTQGALSELDRLIRGVKSGGFLDILSGIIGFGMQLGQLGVFGKTIQSNIASAPSFRAAGGPVMANQPYIVGEKRAELFVPSTSGRIEPNLNGARARGNSYYFSGNLLTPEFWDKIKSMDDEAAMRGSLGGANMVQNSMNKRSRNRLGRR